MKCICMHEAEWHRNVRLDGSVGQKDRPTSCMFENCKCTEFELSD